MKNQITLQAILHVQDFCWSLKYNLTDTELEEMQITLNGVTGLPEVDCFAEHIATFMEVTGHLNHWLTHQYIHLGTSCPNAKIASDN